MQIGKITQVMGPVVDVHFDETPLPYIQTALQVDNHGKKVVMEVMQHIGTDTVRCIMLSPSEGLQKDMPVLSTGMGIEIPVGTQNLGRLFNVLGVTIDGFISPLCQRWEDWIVWRCRRWKNRTDPRTDS